MKNECEFCRGAKYISGAFSASEPMKFLFTNRWRRKLLSDMWQKLDGKHQF